MSRIVIFLLFQFASQNTISGVKAQDYFTPQNIKKFAQSLFEEKDYRRAAGEYQRLLAFSQTAFDSILYKIAVCYELDNQLDKSIRFYERIVQNYPKSPLAEFSHYQLAVIFHLSKRYKQSLIRITEAEPLITQSHLKSDLQYLAGINLIFQKKWNEAVTHFEHVANLAMDNDLTDKLLYGKEIAKRQSAISHKSTIMAGLLSAIIPGSGKIYSNQTGDGIYSILLIALTGYLSFDGFNNKGMKSIKGWTFGTIGGIFYLGNIYGSTIAAQHYNDTQKEYYLNGIDPQIRIYHEIRF